jgi:hypothetical protein
VDSASSSTRWKYGAIALGLGIVAQFFWWQKRVPARYRIGY